MMTDFETLIKPGQTMRFFEKFETISVWFGKTGRGNTCLLSPAAPSYDAFKDFEERGNMYKKMAENFGSSCL
jgi:UDP-N-acetylmuramoylalanine-D-glutamate ligase